MCFLVEFMKLGDDDKIRVTLLYNLRKKRIIGAKHTHFDTLGKGFPSHLGSDVKNIAKGLIKQGFLIMKQTSYGAQVSLNKNKLKEIEEFIFRVIGFSFR